jgi:hypothetical protein
MKKISIKGPVAILELEGDAMKYKKLWYITAMWQDNGNTIAVIKLAKQSKDTSAAIAAAEKDINAKIIKAHFSRNGCHIMHMEHTRN